MYDKNGFYLAELLIALFIFSFGILSLLKYQWQLAKSTHAMDAYYFSVKLLDNVTESVLAGNTIDIQTFQAKVRHYLPDGEATLTSVPLSSHVRITWQREDKGKIDTVNVSRTIQHASKRSS